MRVFITLAILGSICCGQMTALAELRLVDHGDQPRIFGAQPRQITTTWQNSGNSIIEIDLYARIMQLTSATVAPIETTHWKKLRVLPGQTILESTTLELPLVRAETRFLIQWIESTNRVLGSTEVLVYPTNLLAELQPLIGKDDGALGVFDPENQIRPLLKAQGVDFVDLGNTELEKFRGKLAIIGHFEVSTNLDAGLAHKIKTIAANDVAVVWMQPPSDSCVESETKKTLPSFYSVAANRTAAIIVQPGLVAGFADNPQSQLNLIYFCKLALHPQPLTLPFLKLQP